MNEIGQSASSDVVLIDAVADGVVVLRLNRPEARNALVWESWSCLRDALGRIRAEQRTRAVVVSSTGRFFSAGGDLKSTPAHGVGPLSPAARLELAHEVLSTIRSFPVPVIAAVEGGAVGLGWSLALACDLVVAADDAFFSAPFLARGVVPDGAAAWFLVERVGRLRAAELILTGSRLPAPDAKGLGLVSALAASGGAEDEAIAQASLIARYDAAAVELTKRLLARSEGASFESYLPLELGFATVAQLGEGAARARQDFA